MAVPAGAETRGRRRGSTRRPGPPRRRGSAEARRAGAGRGGSRGTGYGGWLRGRRRARKNGRVTPPPRRPDSGPGVPRPGPVGCVDRRGRAGPAGRTAGGAALPRVLAHRPVAGRRGGLPRGRRLLHRAPGLLRDDRAAAAAAVHHAAPFAAVLALLLALLPRCRRLAVDRASRIAATAAIVWYAGWRLIHRTGAWAPLTLALLTAPMLWLQPGLRRHPVRAGQRVHGARLPDGPAPAAPRSAPPSAAGGVGLAMSIKLHPGVFVIHYLVEPAMAEAATAVGTAVTVTLGTWVLPPRRRSRSGAAHSRTRRGSAPTWARRTSPCAVSCCGSARRTAWTVIWLACVAVVGVIGFHLARRLPPPATPSARSRRLDGGAVAGGLDPHLPVVARSSVPTAARPPPAGGGRDPHRVVPLPAAVVGHLVAEPPRVAGVPRPGAAERRHLWCCSRRRCWRGR